MKVGEGYTENFQDSFAGTSTSASAWAIAIYNGMWSYDGQGFSSEPFNGLVLVFALFTGP